MGNSKLLLGIGIGAVLGSLATCFAKSVKGRKMKKDIYDSFHELEGDAASMLLSAKEKAINTGSQIADRVNDTYHNAKGKVGDKLNDLSEELRK